MNRLDCKISLFALVFFAGWGCGGTFEENSGQDFDQSLSKTQPTGTPKSIDLWSVSHAANPYYKIDGTDTSGDMSGFKVELGMDNSSKCQSNGNVVPDCKLSIQGPLGGSLEANLSIVFLRLENLSKSGTAYYEFIFNKYKVRPDNCRVNGAAPEYEISGQLYCELDFSYTYSQSEFQEKRSVRGFCTTDRNVEKALGFYLGGKYHYISYQRNHNVDRDSRQGGPGTVNIGVYQNLASSYESSTMIFDNEDEYTHVRGDQNFDFCVWFEE